MDIHNFLTIASISYKNSFQYTSVLLTELIHEYELSLAINFSIAPLKLLLSVLAVRVPSLALCITNFIHERKMVLLKLTPKLDNFHVMGSTD